MLFRPSLLAASTFLLLAATCAHAGDLWEITSTSVGPDGTPLPFKDTRCLPSNAMDPSAVLGNMGNCTFDQKSGSASNLTFSMVCTTPGMPASLGSMKIVGDARMSGDNFDMRYTITPGPQATGEGLDFKMTGSAQARKKGTCTER